MNASMNNLIKEYNERIEQETGVDNEVLSTIWETLQNEMEDEYEYDDDGEITKTTAYHPTWKESAFRGKLGAPRVSLDGGLIIVKGEFSMLEGELTAMIALGNGLAYPNNSILTNFCFIPSSLVSSKMISPSNPIVSLTK